MEPKAFSCDPFEAIGKDWMLITAEKDGRVNTMTASWGGMGVLWGREVAFIFVRRSRFTKEFIDGADGFSLTFFDTARYRKTLAYLGSVSGRDEDKIAKAGLTVAHKDGVPYFEQAERVLLCTKLSRHFLSPEGILDKSILEKFYADGDYHELYVGAIDAVLARD